MESYTTVLKRASFEYEDRKSVFIADISPVGNEAEALAFLDSVKKKYPDARHHVYAYILRENSIMRFSDDHEPQGTAGMPVLDAIRKNGITDCAIVVTRYFGGTLLGTGGLVRAYSGAAVGAISAAEIITYDIYSEYSIQTGYSEYQRLSVAFEEFGFRLESTRYTDKVELLGRVKKTCAEEFEKKLTEICNGRIKIEFISEKFDF